MDSLDPVRNFYSVPAALWIRAVGLVLSLFIAYLLGSGDYLAFTSDLHGGTGLIEIYDIPGKLFDAVFDSWLTALVIPALLISIGILAYSETSVVLVISHIVPLVGAASFHGGRIVWNFGSLALSAVFCFAVYIDFIAIRAYFSKTRT